MNIKISKKIVIIFAIVCAIVFFSIYFMSPFLIKGRISTSKGFDSSFYFEKDSLTLNANDIEYMPLHSDKSQDIIYSSSNPSIATIDKNGNICGISKGETTISARSNNNVATLKVIVNSTVIALDAGHGAKDTGAERMSDGKHYTEKDIAFDITSACEKELQNYSGISTVLTRPNDISYIPVADRAIIAKNKGADLLISYHIDSCEGDVSGAKVIVTTSNYKKSYNEESSKLAKSILLELSDLGLPLYCDDMSTAIFTRPATDGITYSFDGSLSDYYGIITVSIERDLPAILIEHGYISSDSDFNLMKTQEQRVALGQKDALGIVKYLNLKKATVNTTKPVLVANLALYSKEKNLSVGETSSVSTKVFPFLAENKKLSYKSSNKNVATVDENGIITAISDGEAQITVSTTDDSNLSETCKVIVK